MLLEQNHCHPKSMILDKCKQLTFQIGPVAIAIILVSFASLFGFISLLCAWYELPKTLPSEAKGVLVGCVRSWWQLSGTCGICSSLHRLYLDLSSLLCFVCLFVCFISFISFISSISRLTWMIQSHPKWEKKGLRPLGFYHPQNSSVVSPMTFQIYLASSVQVWCGSCLQKPCEICGCFSLMSTLVPSPVKSP